MKQITEPIAVSSYVQSEYAAVLNRLQSMGFTHRSGYSIDLMMKDWDTYCVFDISGNSSQHYNRNASDESYDNLIPAAQFLAEYGPAEVDAPETPMNPPNFYIDTHDIPTLRKIAQELAFEAGMKWGCGDKTLASFTFRNLLVVRKEDNRPTRAWSENTLYCGDPVPYEGIPVYSAATQLGEIIRILSIPVVPPAPPSPIPPEIHGYKAIYSPGAPTVDFGCAHIDLGIIREAHDLMEKSRTGTRQVFGITLSSGKTLSREQVTKILGYIAAVEEYAKKYPQKS